MDPQAESLGRLVRRHRLRAGLTQRELAAGAGTSVRTVRDIELGRISRPHLRSLRGLATALGLSGADRRTLLAGASTGGDGDRAGGGLQVAILGPLVVRRSGVDLEVSPPMLRRLLCMLALSAGRTLPREEIVDALWADRPPSSCRSLVNGYVRGLRTVLAGDDPGGADQAVVRVGSGYRLRLPDVDVDLVRFDALVADARQEHHAGRVDAARELFERALGLWRGPLDSTDPEIARHPAAVAAAERRVDVAVVHADLAIDAGRYRSAAETLRSIAREYPLHEGLHARLMLALAGLGEQATAHEVFAAIRARLVDELGVGPGAELREAYIRILHHDVAVEAGSPVVPGTAASAGEIAPAQLPAGVPSFVGRTAYLDRLDALLLAGDEPAAAGVPIAVVSGTAGVGKTALALHWAHRSRARYPGGQLYVNLRGFDPNGTMVAPDEALGGFLEALGVPPQRQPRTLPARAALYRSALAGRRVLVVLDNARHAEQVRPLLPGLGGCGVLVTSRSELAGLIAAECAGPVSLSLFPATEAHELMTRRLGPERINAEPDAVEDIISRCALLPLALAVVAGRAALQPALPLASLADALGGAARDAQTGLDSFASDDQATDLRAVFSWSYRALSPPAGRLFRLLGIQPGPDTSLSAAASLAGLSPSQVRPLMAELVGSHLIVEHRPGRYAMHDLLRAYAAETACTVDSDAQRGAALHRALDHHLHTAFSAARLLHPARDPIALSAAPRPGVTPDPPADRDAAFAWFGQEHAVLIAAVRLAEDRGLDAHVWQLAWTLADYLERQGHWRDWTTTQRMALAAAVRLGDPAAQALTNRLLARAYNRQGRFDDSQTCLWDALALYRRIGDRHGEAHTHLNLGGLRERQNRIAEALDHARQAHDLFLAADHLPGLGVALNNVGWYHGLLGDHASAIASCRQALALHQRIANRYGEANAWDSLGYAHRHLGDFDQALECYGRALFGYRDISDRYNEADVLGHLADTYEAIGDVTTAVATYQRAVQILEELGHADATMIRTRLERVRRPDVVSGPPRLP